MSEYRISNSEVTTWLTCQRRYFYQYDLNLKPKTYTSALTRGIIGHELLQTYYTELKNGQAKSTAIATVKNQMMSYSDSNFEILNELNLILTNYWNMVDDSDWEILEVECSYDLNLGDGLNYVMRHDLLVRIKSLNQIALVDHKFVYDFWSSDDLKLSPQFPKYMAALRANGVVVDRCVLNQLRYRQIKPENWTIDKLFNRAVDIPTPARMRNSLQEQITASRQILKHKSMGTECGEAYAFATLKLDTAPVRNKMACRSCNVKELCLSEYDGGDVSYMMETMFEKNSQYGYNNEIVAETERF